MIKIQKLIVTSLLALTLSACASHFESVNQVNDSAILQLEGAFMNSQLIIDDETTIQLTEDSVNTSEINGKTVARFPLSTGKHTIKVIKNNQLIVERIIYVTNANTFEVSVP